MTEKELKKLSRREILELLMIQTQRAEELEKMTADLKKQLSENRVFSKSPGNIAQTALQLNGVFESAQAAADLYINNIESCSERCDKMLMETQKRCEEAENQTETKILKIKDELEKILNDFKAIPQN